MPDWGGKYARHDTNFAAIKRALASWEWPPVVVDEPRRCDCWKQVAPLCDECQDYNRKRKQETA
jgi:hypothetical protein